MGQLSETYTGARNLALITVSVITATSIASGTVGVSVMGLDMSQAPLVTVATVCLVMMFFAGFGLIMGWAHTTKKKRVQVSSRVDLAISGTVIVIGISYCIYLATNTNINISASPGLFAVFAYASVFGWVIYMWLLRSSHFVYLLYKDYRKLIRSNLYIYLLRRGGSEVCCMVCGDALHGGLDE